MQQPDTDFDAHVAAAIAYGMREVAMADGGGIHQREMSLISAFEGEIPSGTKLAPASSLAEEGVRDTYLKSLIMVGLADGVVSEPELVVLRRLAAEVDVDDAALDALIVEVKREFLSTFENVRIFSDSVDEIRRSLGL